MVSRCILRKKHFSKRWRSLPMRIKSWQLLHLTPRGKVAQAERGKKCKLIQELLMDEDIKSGSISLLLCNPRLDTITSSSRWTMNNLKETSLIRSSSIGNLSKTRLRVQVTTSPHPNYPSKIKGFQAWQIPMAMNSLLHNNNNKLLQGTSYNSKCLRRMFVEVKICQEKIASFLQLIKTVRMEH